MDPNATPELPAGELLWTLTKDGRRFACELISQGKYGWDCRFLEGDEVLDGRRFPMRAQALDWADSERQEHEREGWTADIGRESSPGQEP
jgi:hypothetical protein